MMYTLFRKQLLQSVCYFTWLIKIYAKVAEKIVFIFIGARNYGYVSHLPFCIALGKCEILLIGEANVWIVKLKQSSYGL